MDDAILRILRDHKGSGGCNEWEIASSLYPWGDSKQRQKHGAWIRVVIGACARLQKQGLVGYYFVSHGDGVPGTRIWCVMRT